MIFEDECGWMKDRETGRYYFYLPEEAINDPDLLRECMALLSMVHPDEDDAEETIN